jgi:hypothetical protein
MSEFRDCPYPVCGHKKKEMTMSEELDGCGNDGPGLESPEDEIVLAPTVDGALGIGDRDGLSIAIPLEQVPGFIKRVTEAYGIMLVLGYDRVMTEEGPWITETN